MRKTLQQQIAANTRASYFFAVMLVILLGSLGAVIVGVWKPAYWPYGAAGAAALGAIVSIVSLTSGSSIVLAISRAREATHEEDTVLDNVTEEMAIAAGIPKPKIYVIDDSAPNAFATGNNPQGGVLCVTTGLLSKLNRDELQGVVAHEMSHIRNYDIRFMTAIALIAGLIPLLADFFLRSLWFGGGSRRSDDNNDSNGIFVIIGIILAILAPIFAVLLQLAVSRQREFLADAGAADLTRYPEGLANALMKIDADPDPLEAANRATQHMYIVNPLKGAGSSMFSTHPSTEDRVKALMNLMGAYQTQKPAVMPDVADQTLEH